jgi:hypothetical protein
MGTDTNFAVRTPRVSTRASRNWLSVAIVLLGAVLAGGQDRRQFTGVITDDMCARADHSKMQMGSNDAECVKACIEAHGAQYVLFDGEHAYVLSDQKTPEKFAAQRVTVTGTLNAKTHTIQVESIAAAK